MKDKLSASEKRLIFRIVIIGLILMTFFFVMRNIDDLWRVLSTLFRMLMPFILGYGLSFILHPLEKKIKKHLPFEKDKVKQGVATLLSTLFAVLCFILIVLFILPDLISSIISVSEQLPSLLSSLQSFYESIEINENITNLIQNSITQAQQFLVNSLSTSITSVLSGALDFTNMFINLFLALTVSIYVSLDRTFFSRNAKKISLAIFGTKITQRLVQLSEISSEVFKQYFYSKGASSVLLGAISFLVLALIGIKHPLLIATVFGLFNMIPLFGFVASMFLITIFLMLVQIQAIISVLVILIILKLIENLFISKRWFGEAFSLPTFWVLVALVLGNYYFNIIGLFLSVPIATIIYIVIQNWVQNRGPHYES